MGGVRLREWRADDAEAISVMVDDPHLRRWSSLIGLGEAAWIEAQRSGERGPSLAICGDEDDRALGKMALRLPELASGAVSCAAVRERDRPAAELSYWVLPYARGRGLAGTAVELMLARARQIEGLRSVVLDIEQDNLASVRVAQRVGAQRRQPPRTVTDRAGVTRTMVVYLIALDPLG